MGLGQGIKKGLKQGLKMGLGQGLGQRLKKGLRQELEQGWDRDYISDGTRGDYGACWFDGDGAVRGDGMRGDRVGVGDIGAMPCGARRTGDASCGADGRGAVTEPDGGILIGLRLC